MPCTIASLTAGESAPTPWAAAPWLAEVNTLTRMASPSEPPTCCMTFTMLAAAPASRGSTPASEAMVSGTNTTPMPAPSSSIGPSTPGT